MSRRAFAALRTVLRVPARALVVCSCLGAATATAQPHSDSTWRDHDRALQAARAANDTVVYRAQLSAIYREIGATPRIATRFAALALGARDTAAAARWMGALAAMGTELDSGMLAQYSELCGAEARASLMLLRLGATRDAGAPELIFRLPDANMIAEDIAFDGEGSRFLVSSVRRGRVYQRRTHGSTIVTALPTPDGSWGIFAIGVDSARRTIWATTAAMAMAARYTPGDSGRSALLQLDSRTGKLRKRYAAPDSGAHALGDLTISATGAVYVSDGVGSGVYVLDPGGAALRALVPPGVLVSPQTPALSADGATLLVPDYAIGIAAVDIATGAVKWLAHSDSLALTGIDGMYRLGNDIIAVQNGLEPNRIVRLALDASMRRVVSATTLVQGPQARELTHAAISRGSLYFIAKSGWERVADDGAMREAAQADAPVIQRMRIAP